VILYLHGGGYVSCSVRTHRPNTAGLARRTGCRVFAVEYRLAPEHPFPAALDDAEAAYRWLVSTGIDPASIAVAGDSAGGGMTLALLMRLRETTPELLPACAVMFSPWTDLAGTGQSGLENDGRCAMFHPENLTQFAVAYLGGASPHDPAASPIFGDFAKLPPVLLHVSSTELLLDDARRVHEGIEHSGGTSVLHVFDDVSHGWQLLDGLVPEAGASLGEAAMFVRDHL
jgi:acetyl esterase/lipase